MTGGVPINTFRNLIDMDWLNDLIDNNSCIKGVVFAENHHNGDTNAVAQLTAEYLELFSSKGIYLVLTDIDDANHRMEKWFENDTLFKTAQKHHKYLVINSKSTSSSGYNTEFADVAYEAGMLTLDRTTLDRKSTRLNSSHRSQSRMPSSA